MDIKLVSSLSPEQISALKDLSTEQIREIMMVNKSFLDALKKIKEIFVNGDNFYKGVINAHVSFIKTFFNSYEEVFYYVPHKNVSDRYKLHGFDIFSRDEILEVCPIFDQINGLFPVNLRKELRHGDMRVFSDLKNLIYADPFSLTSYKIMKPFIKEEYKERVEEIEESEEEESEEDAEGNDEEED